jgi:hypothetical protein
MERFDEPPCKFAARKANGPDLALVLISTDIGIRTNSRPYISVSLKKKWRINTD